MRRPSNIRYIEFGPGSSSGGGFLTRIVALFFGVLVFGAAVFVGAVFIAGLIGFILIASLIFMLRVWWLRRQMEKYEKTHGDLDAEYTVLDNDAGRSRNVQDSEK